MAAISKISSAQDTSSNGEGSSSSAAAAANSPPDPALPPAPAPPPAPGPPSGVAHLQSREDEWPPLIKAILNISGELARISLRLRNLPIQRELSFNDFKWPGVELDTTNNQHIGTVKPHYNVTAMLIYATGRELNDDEACCGMGGCMKGIFPKCIVPAEEDDEELTSPVACVNCQYDGMGSKCPLQIAHNRRIAREAREAQIARNAQNIGDDEEYEYIEDGDEDMMDAEYDEEEEEEEEEDSDDSDE